MSNENERCIVREAEECCTKEVSCKAGLEQFFENFTLTYGPTPFGPGPYDTGPLIVLKNIVR